MIVKEPFSGLLSSTLSTILALATAGISFPFRPPPTSYLSTALALITPVVTSVVDYRIQQGVKESPVSHESAPHREQATVPRTGCSRSMGPTASVPTYPAIMTPIAPVMRSSNL